MPSIMQRIGTPNSRHNLDIKYRKHLQNVDPELSKFNEIVRHRPVEEIYQEYLQPAFDTFNAQQKRKDRRLDTKYGCSTYLEYQRILDKKAQSSKNKIDKKGRPPIREIVWQFGNPKQGYGSKDQTAVRRQKIRDMLVECQQKAEQRYSQIVWGDIVLHADEVSVDADDQEHGTIHLHSSFVPLCFQNKQGPAVQVAFERCLHEMGFDSFNEWKRDLDQLMEEVLESHGLSRTYMDNHNEHMESSQYHRQEAEKKRTKELEKERIVAESRLGAMTSAVNKKLDNIGREMDMFIQSLVESTENQKGSVYNDALFYICNCGKTQLEEISNKGRQLRKEMVRHEFLPRVDTEQQSLEKIIAGISSGKLVMKKISWEQRQKLWEEYRECSEYFWSVRNDLMKKNQETVFLEEQKQNDAMRFYYDALYFLESSRGILTTIIGVIWLLIAEFRQEKYNSKLEALYAEQKKLIRITGSFTKFSREYREELKEGRLPYERYLNIMTDIIRNLDREYKSFFAELNSDQIERMNDERSIANAHTR